MRLKVANLLLLAIAVAALGIAVMALARRDVFLIGTMSTIVYLVVPTLAALALAAALRLPAFAKWQLLFCLIAAGIGMIGAEVRMYVGGPAGNPAEAVAKARDIAFDPRTPVEVVADFRAAGTPTQPPMFPSELRARGIALEAGGGPLQTLGGIANVNTVYCNEFGRYPSYRSDRYGFNNPDTVWRAAGNGLVVVGDSFAHGACTDRRDSIVGMLRGSYPNAVNFGMGSNGPLTELATLREYGAGLRPRFVVWLFFEGNDLGNLLAERNTPVLPAYLRPDFTQDLRQRQPEIDKILTARSAELFEEALAENRRRRAEERAAAGTAWLRDLVSIVKLQRLRRALRLDPSYFDAAADAVTEDERRALAPENLALLRDVLVRAREDGAAWDGRILFVYLPAPDRYFGVKTTLPRLRQTHAAVIDVARAAGLPVLDLTTVFAAADRPRDLFFHAGSHYNEPGNALVAERIVEALRGIDR